MTNFDKPFSVRLPLSTAAKLAAYCGLNPQSNRTENIILLLNIALTGYELHLPEHQRQIFLHAAEDLHIAMALGSPVMPIKTHKINDA